LLKIGKRNEYTSETQWENTKKVVRTVASEVDGFEKWKGRHDWYDEESQINV